NARESCGKCTPCREGTARLLELLDGVPRAGVAGSLATLRELADVVQLASLCGLGQAAPLSLKAALDHFPIAFSETSRPA
ncbi:MAG TPA: NADH-ubiquinone oxidoreductase-F iron-sulfur binding region domain-containing protein, partial [Methylomirabilota bacterium]|nr:NADH-ubiquinone oxidoreductase-F iron-sulfur binding region domain-containing protein [Methylomirabilota bacterium]